MREQLDEMGKTELVGGLLLALGIAAVIALCLYAGGKISENALRGELNTAGVEPALQQEVFKVIALPGMRQTLSNIRIPA